MKELLRDIWEAKKIEWRKDIAIMKTRGFWCVQVMWFVAGGIFFRLLPPKQPEAELVNYLLNQLLIIVIMLPVYFTIVLSWSGTLNRLIAKYKARINSKSR